MNLDEAQSIHCVGIGGIGVSAVARLLYEQGKKVSGSDLVRSVVTDDLKRLGVKIIIGPHAAAHIPSDVDLVVGTVAASEDNAEIIAARNSELPVLSYPEAVAQLTAGKELITVSGTHGKSTTTALIAHIFTTAGLDPSVIVGSRLTSLNGNARLGRGKHFILEADEYARAFLHYAPTTAVITNIEADHLDVYSDVQEIEQAFEEYVRRIPLAGRLIRNADDPAVMELTPAFDVTQATFGLRGGDYRADIQQLSEPVTFTESHVETVHLRLPGRHNIANALAAIAAADQLGVPTDAIRQGVESFPGLWRRFERVGEYRGCPVISDYAHHPTAIRVTLQAAREYFPGRRVLLAFQPHHHHRTRVLFDAFVDALAGADQVILAEIYGVAGREDPANASVSSEQLVAELLRHNVAATFAADTDSALVQVRQSVRARDIILIVGAGSIDIVARRLVEKKEMSRVAALPNIQEHVPLSPRTTMKIGGPARWFISTKTREELIAAIRAARRDGIPFFVVGKGSNILVADAGFPGLVISVETHGLINHDGLVEVDAGVSLGRLNQWAAQQGLSGAEFLCGIPGTVGASVRGNAGAWGSEMKDIVAWVDVLTGDNGEKRLVGEDCAFDYRTSRFKQASDVILRAGLRLEPGQPDEIRARLRELGRKKLEQQEFSLPSAGCMFKNPPGGFAAKMIDELGLKGYRMGDAMVSTKHANFIVNADRATAAQIMELNTYIRARVRERYGVDLQMEVQQVGFDS